MLPSLKRGGGRYCSIYKCHNSQRKLTEWRESTCNLHITRRKDCACLEPFRFYYFPRDKERQRNWVSAVNRKGFKPTRDSVVCSIHFPDDQSPKTRTPQLHLGYDKKVSHQRRTVARLSLPPKHRHLPRQNFRMEETQEPAGEPSGSAIIEPAAGTEEVYKEHSPTPIFENITPPGILVSHVEHDHDYYKRVAIIPVEVKNAFSQTDSFWGSSLLLNIKDCIYYTGLQPAVVNSLINTLSPLSQRKFKISVTDQLLLVLMRLRLGLALSDLARRFGISKSSSSVIFNSWISIMADNLRDLIVWLPRETIIGNLPTAFQEDYPNTTCILDCSEIFTERPHNLQARACTWSNYKSHNTLKFLVCIAPHGYIMFVSPLYGGRASDKFICADSGLFKYLLPGDEVMADRGLLISDELATIRVALNVPPYLKDRDQMTEEETVSTRRCASLRVHVERAIARMKSYRLLKGVIPATIRHNLDDVVTVCAALCNLKSDLIRSSNSDL